MNIYIYAFMFFRSQFGSSYKPVRRCHSIIPTSSAKRGRRRHCASASGDPVWPRKLV